MRKFETKYGHFDNNGTEYVIKSPRLPKPWVNVISNGSYGLVVSQTGGGFSWDTHSEFNRLTRWHQDLIQDNWGKYIYVKNNQTGEFWSPTWIPVKKDLDKYECRFGTGYAIFTTEYQGVEIVLTIFVPFNESLEIWDIKVVNHTEKDFDLSFYTYLEWVLGSSNDHHREFHKQFLETKYDESLNALLATKRLWDIPLGDRGHWNIEYEYTGFISANIPLNGYEGDKEAFIGQYGSLQSPKAVMEGKFEGKTGAFNDSIGAIKLDVSVKKNDQSRFDIYLGLKKEQEEIKKSLERFESFEAIDNALDNVKKEWEKLLSPLEVNTPDDALNYSVNTWFRYQAIAGRLWGRTAYYQQSGAFGFRDQLQDSLVYLPINPELTKKQISLHARHQFVNGAVLHWWHPIAEVGLPTEMTDDLLWLPYIITHYLDETEDYSLLDQKEVYYDDNELSESIYVHSVKAIEKVLSRFSERGLPLIGAGDWNDGLSAVGIEMKGESVWLAEFLYIVLNKFALIAEKRGDTDNYKRFTEKSDQLKKDFNEHAWDGEWFFRGTKDSGVKFGSKECEEGKIFLNPQTWSVISGITDKEREEKAMNGVTKHLLRNNGCLLLSPAYSKPDKFIGYLSRYAAGRRENGGVYSHASTWAVWAYSLMKDADNAYEVFKRLSPIYSGMQPDTYVAEPYVMPGNIDGPDSPSYGMGGWTWYTGSAAWFQKVIVDHILGIRASEEGLVIDPMIPKEWKEYFVKRTFRGTEYNIQVINNEGVSHGVKKITLDSEVINGNVIISDKNESVNVIVEMGK